MGIVKCVINTIKIVEIKCNETSVRLLSHLKIKMNQTNNSSRRKEKKVIMMFTAKTIMGVYPRNSHAL